MTEQERNLILKTGLWLHILAGWVPTEAVAVKMGVAAEKAGDALGWLVSQGYLDTSLDLVRWNPTPFASLWSQLIPDRPCPIAPLRVGRKKVDHS